MTVQRYRAVDLFLFAGMLIIFETVIITAATRWFPGEAYTVSLVAAITAIVMMRWGPWAAIHAVIGGIVFCRASGGGPMQYAIYCGGNLFSLGGLLLLRWMGDENIRQDTLKTLLFGFTVLLLMQAGRALVALMLGVSPQEALGFIFTDVVSMLFTLVILWIVRRLDGVFENQHHYLLRVQREQEKERGGFR